MHPEAYPVVERILADVKAGLARGDRQAATCSSALDAKRYTDERFGLPTVQDILKELEKPGRDPRPEFRTAAFKEGVEDLKDLQPGMLLEGVVTNVTNFGAFVDIGVHQDGLVHISAMSEKFVKDPREVVKAGDIVKVKVLEVDLARKRVALTMRMTDDPARREAPSGARPANAGARPADNRGTRPRPSAPPPARNEPAPRGAMAEALARALKR